MLRLKLKVQFSDGPFRSPIGGETVCLVVEFVEECMNTLESLDRG